VHRKYLEREREREREREKLQGVAGRAVALLLGR
jgi:hypothetical protein